MKVVVNRCYGGFGLSPKAHTMIAERKGFNLFFYKNSYSDGSRGNKFYKVKEPDDELFCLHMSTKDLGDTTDSETINKFYYSKYNFDGKLRADPDLIAVVEELGEEASGCCAKLEIVEIPDGVDFIIEEHDGMEHIAEAHRTW